MSSKEELISLIEALRADILSFHKLFEKAQFSSYVNIQESYQSIKKKTDFLKKPLDILQGKLGEPKEEENVNITLFRSSIGAVKAAFISLEKSIDPSKVASKTTYLFFDKNSKSYNETQKINIQNNLKNLTASLNLFEEFLLPTNNLNQLKL
ncbi:hypothetical protein [Rickettsiella endosymbiont of Aleochara curtula]|jgi:hypothetical protein|uniref:hypothetical protein n=1 Tax=Rickettsiella endosymbiont of Aleochara curtula TaxID=3077936 RepID=UPI00313B1B47